MASKSWFEENRHLLGSWAPQIEDFVEGHDKATEGKRRVGRYVLWCLDNNLDPIQRNDNQVDEYFGEVRLLRNGTKHFPPPTQNSVRRWISKWHEWLEPASAAAYRQMFVLTWNPKPQDMSSAKLDDHLDRCQRRIQATEDGGTWVDWWSTGKRKSGINEGDDLVLFLHGTEGGIIASGTAVSEIYQDFDGGEEEQNWVNVEWQCWVAAEDCLPLAQLRSSIAPKFFEYIPRASGQQLSDTEADSLRQAWHDWRNELLIHPPPLSGEEEGVRAASDRKIPEGAVVQTRVNRYERSSWARAKCLRHYGYKCQVCGFDFEERYGKLGKGFMHVHHLTPLHEIAGNPDYLLDPIKDLRPVCPNCHAMLHRPKSGTLTVEELQGYLRAAQTTT